MLNLYCVVDMYINYLRQFDTRIYENKDKRPYIGVVCSVNGINYYVPLSSPKPKHAKMKNTKDFHKIKEGQYGAVNFNYMIPVDRSDLVLIDIKNEPDAKYKNLLTNQYLEIVRLDSVIRKKANDLYKLVQSNNNALTPNDIKIKQRCCNFPFLEQKMTEYISSNRCGNR